MLNWKLDPGQKLRDCTANTTFTLMIQHRKHGKAKLAKNPELNMSEC